jgi:acyl transferase domain-containing protein
MDLADKMEPIAIVGIGCRFPGDATSPAALWEMLVKGVSAWSEFPSDRINISAYYHPKSGRHGSVRRPGIPSSGPLLDKQR